MKPGWKVGLPIYTTGYIVELMGHSPHEESIYRKLTGGNARWHCGAGRQDRTASRGDHPQPDL